MDRWIDRDFDRVSFDSRLFYPNYPNYYNKIFRDDKD